MRQIFSLLISFLLMIQPVMSYAYSPSLSLLPDTGEVLTLTNAFHPPLLKGMRIDAQYPLTFNFILDQGQNPLSDDQLHQESQKMIHYFLAALTIPQQDLWVNLSPVEKDRIIPDMLIQTELGRDLLAQDYLLKQLSASLIHPEQSLGKTFWEAIYREVYQKFGVVELDMDALNKIWIVPTKADVFEKNNMVYIQKIELKAMLETDYQALESGALSDGDSQQDLAKQVLREIIVPAIETEVNTGKHFAPLRQMIHAIVLAQWYDDVFKTSLLHKVYQHQNKVKGIDLSHPQEKERIYQQYLQAYQKGVFNYIREEKDAISQEMVPVKYFAGGIPIPQIPRNALSSRSQDPQNLLTPDYEGLAREFSEISVALKDASYEVPLSEVSLGDAFLENDFFKFDSAETTVEPSEQWLSFQRVNDLLKELEDLWEAGGLNHQKAAQFFQKYSLQVQYEVSLGNPIQGMWPVLKAIILLGQDKEKELVSWIENTQPVSSLSRLMVAVLLMHGHYDEQWVENHAQYLKERPYYFLSMEIDFKAGGLGPVNVTHTKFMKALGASVIGVQPMYSTRFDTGKPKGEPLDYVRDMGVTQLKLADQGQFQIRIGNEDVNVEVFEGVNKEGVLTYLIRDVQKDGSSKYTKTLYRYQMPENPVSKEETMGFFNVAAAQWLNILETQRKNDLQNDYQSPIVHPQDGQMAPFIAVMKSQYPLLKQAMSLGTTHTILNVGTNDLDATHWFLKEMLHISDEYISAFKTNRFFNVHQGRGEDSEGSYIHHTMGMINLVNIPTGVSQSHAEHMSQLYQRRLQAITNGDDPTRISSFFRESVQQLFPQVQRLDYLSPREVMLAKELSVQRFNDLRILTANGEILLNTAKQLFRRSAEHLIEDLQDLTDSEVDVLIHHAQHVLRMNIASREQVRHGFVVNIDAKNMTLGYARRLVWEKNNFDPALIKELVKLGFNVVFMGNHQGQASEELAMKYRTIETEINEEREQALAQGEKNLYPGKFFFVQHFTEEQKIAFLGATNVYFMLNQPFLGAHEVTEENPGPNYAYQMALSHRNGGTTDWLMPTDFSRSGSGSLLMLPEHTSYLKWVHDTFIPLKELWDQGEPFYANAVLSAQMNRIQQGQVTASGYLLAVNDFLAQQNKYQEEDQKALHQIVKHLHQKTDLIEEILNTGSVGMAPFYFRAHGVSMVPKDAGLKSFLQMIQEAETLYGYDSLFEDSKYYGQFLLGLFKSNPEAQKALSLWLGRWHQMAVDTSYPKDMLMEKNERMKRFLTALIQNLESDFDDSDSAVDAAGTTPTGGIDARYLMIDRQGEWQVVSITDAELEQSLIQCDGLKATILSVTPIENIESLFLVQ